MLVQGRKEEYELLLLLLLRKRGFAMAKCCRDEGGGGRFESRTNGVWWEREAAKVDGLRELGESATLVGRAEE